MLAHKGSTAQPTQRRVMDLGAPNQLNELATAAIAPRQSYPTEYYPVNDKKPGRDHGSRIEKN